MRFSLLVLLLVAGLRVFSAHSETAAFRCASGQAVHKPNPLVLNFFKKQNQRKKVVASALAFPLPFGFLGLHRIYLGTRPYIPVMYVGTLGGCAGILPMIDFVSLVYNKDISRFQANPRIFMWISDETKK